MRTAFPLVRLANKCIFIYWIYEKQLFTIFGVTAKTRQRGSDSPMLSVPQPPRLEVNFPKNKLLKFDTMHLLYFKAPNELRQLNRRAPGNEGKAGEQQNERRRTFEWILFLNKFVIKKNVYPFLLPWYPPTWDLAVETLWQYMCFSWTCTRHGHFLPDETFSLVHTSNTTR